jgi:RNA polymerase sigma-32 factor
MLMTKKPESPKVEVLSKEEELAGEDNIANQDIIEAFRAESNDEQINIIENLLPTKSMGRELVGKSSGEYTDTLKQYIKDISRHKLLTPLEEEALISKLMETGDIETAKKLVLANLRLVVKISLEYKSAYQNVMDLIQEGNIGLMKAVSKYNPDKGAKLSYYASWWIKSYVLKFILDNFRLIKIGTTADQKKLFYNLMKEKDRLTAQGIVPTTKLISENLGVSEKSVVQMDHRLGSSGSEVSIDYGVGVEGEGSIGDFLASPDLNVDDALSHLESLDILQDNLKDFLADLKDRDRDIFKKRLLSEVPPSLQSIADDYGVSRERIRQIEERLLNKLKVYMSDFLK